MWVAPKSGDEIGEGEMSTSMPRTKAAQQPPAEAGASGSNSALGARKAAGLALSTLALLLLVLLGPLAAPKSPAQAAGAIQLRVSLVDNAVSGTSDLTGTVTLSLTAPDGSVRAGGRAEAYEPGTAWEAHLVDTAGNAVSPRPQDRLVASLNATREELLLPRMGTRFDRAGDIVAGTTAPGLPVEVQLGKGAALRTQSTTADGAGAWQTAFGPDGDLRGAAPVTVTVRTAAGHLVLLPRQVPMVRASLHPGDITGIMAPYGLVTASLAAADGVQLGVGQSVADHAGRFSTWLRDPAGRVLRPQAGQRLTLSDGDDTLALTIGPLWATWDLAANRIHGTGVPGTAVELTVWNPWFPGENDYPTTEVDAQGRWQTVPAVALHPASHFYVLERLAEGDEFYYCQQVPMLHLSPGTPQVMAETLWEITVDLELVRTGAVVARAQGGGRWSSNVYLILRDDDGEPVAMQPGDTLRALLDDWRQTVAVPELSAVIDAPSGQLVGRATPGQVVALGDQLPFGKETVAGPDGRYALDVSEFLVGGGVGPGKRFEAYFPAQPSGHHIRQAFRGPEIYGTLGESAVFGRAQPGAEFNLQVVTQGGQVTIVANGEADLYGRVALRLAEARLAPGDEISLATGGSGTQLRLPALTVAMDPATGLVTGQAPAGELVELVPHAGFAGDHPEHLFAFADDQGHWSTNVWDRGRGGPAVDPASISELEVLYRDGANIARLVRPGPLTLGEPLLLPWLGR